jgi:hypothetical protein
MQFQRKGAKTQRSKGKYHNVLSPETTLPKTMLRLGPEARKIVARVEA